MRKLLMLFVILTLALIDAPRESDAATIAVSSGWANGSVTGPDDVLAFDFALDSVGYFSLLDCCTGGDIWTITGGINATSLFILYP